LEHKYFILLCPVYQTKLLCEFDVKQIEQFFVFHWNDKYSGVNGGFMKKSSLVLLSIAVMFVAFSLLPQSGFAGVNVNVGINVPLPAFVFHAPPPVVVVPGTYAYAVPDIDIDIVFYQGYWYRPHRDRWYRSTSYNGPWIVRDRVPAELHSLPPDYRHMPPGHQRIPYGQMKKNWKSWERDKHWDKHGYKHEAKHEHKEDSYSRHKEEKREHKKGGKGGHGRD